MKSLMSVQGFDVLVAIIAIALHGSNICLTFVSWMCLLDRSKVALKVSHKHSETPSETEIHEFCHGRLLRGLPTKTNGRFYKNRGSY